MAFSVNLHPAISHHTKLGARLFSTSTCPGAPSSKRQPLNSSRVALKFRHLQILARNRLEQSVLLA